MTSTNKQTNQRTNKPAVATNQPTNKPINQLTSLTNLTIILFLAISCLLTATAYAADFAGSLKSVSITDSAGANQPPTAVINYTQNGDIYTFDASGSSDPGGSIVEYKWDFGDGGTATGVVANHSFAVGEFSVSLALVDNSDGIALASQQIVFAAYSLVVNFQPVSSLIPEGFKVDSGEMFDTTREYGWVIAPNYRGTRDRDSVSAPGQEYDTLIIVDPGSIWEAIVPNGQYNVTIAMGDPEYYNYYSSAQVEGFSIVQFQPQSDNLLTTKTIPVTVYDGRITLSFVGSYPYGGLCWLSIEQF